jgi:hypothetical protein
VFVPPGTFNERVDITTEGLTLQGSGYSTLIDGGTSPDDHPVDMLDDNITVKNFRAKNDSNGSTDSGTATPAVIKAGGVKNPTAINITITESDRDGIRFEGVDNPVTIGCTIRGTIDRNGFHNFGTNGIIANCIVDGPSSVGIDAANNTIVTNNVVSNCSLVGINSNDRNSIVIGNRVINSGNNGIQFTGIDNIIANNRISGSTTADIDDTGTGTLLDGNLTGPSN